MYNTHININKWANIGDKLQIQEKGPKQQNTESHIQTIHNDKSQTCHTYVHNKQPTEIKINVKWVLL